jgi:hypothetical protein
MVEQSIVEVVAVTVKLLVFVAPVAELAARVNAGVVASTGMRALLQGPLRVGGRAAGHSSSRG